MNIIKCLFLLCFTMPHVFVDGKMTEIDKGNQTKGYQQFKRIAPCGIGGKLIHGPFTGQYKGNVLY